jgi:hypothetical protein
MAKKLVLTREHFLIVELPVPMSGKTNISLIHKATGLRATAETLEKAAELLQASLNKQYEYEVRIRIN